MENIIIPARIEIVFLFINMSTIKTSKSHDKKKVNLVEKISGSLFNESHPPAVKEEILLTTIKKSILCYCEDKECQSKKKVP